MGITLILGDMAVVASSRLWTRTGLHAVEPGHGVHAALLAVDEQEMAAVRAHALRVSGASARSGPLAVLLLLVVHALVCVVGWWCYLEGIF